MSYGSHEQTFTRVNVYKFQEAASLVSFRIEHIYTFDANILIIVKFTYQPVFTYFFVNPLFTVYIFIIGIFNKPVLTAQIIHGGYEKVEKFSAAWHEVVCDFKRQSRNVVQEDCDNVQKLS
jgi:hypothetical protein